METLLLSRSDVEKSLDIREVIEGVRAGYEYYQRKEVEMPPIVSMDMPKSYADCDIKSCYNAGNDTMSIKVAALYNKNGDINDLPRMMGSVLLYDTRDGNALAIMEGGLITGIRTGAAGAISCDLLARKDSRVVAMLGGGGQARMQLRALAQVRNIDLVKVYSEFPKELAGYKADIESELGINVKICETVEETMKGADIAISTTPSSKYMADASMIRPGMHIVAVGADTPGKNEWDPHIFEKADKIVCDSIDQCVERGETRNAIIRGIISKSDIYGEIGEILIGAKAGRESDEEITIFDTTGMGVQDNVTALKVYENAVRNGYGMKFRFF